MSRAQHQLIRSHIRSLSCGALSAGGRCGRYPWITATITFTSILISLKGGHPLKISCEHNNPLSAAANGIVCVNLQERSKPQVSTRTRAAGKKTYHPECIYVGRKCNVCLGSLGIDELMGLWTPWLILARLPEIPTYHPSRGANSLGRRGGNSQRIFREFGQSKVY
jgi:hypothetical protein